MTGPAPPTYPPTPPPQGTKRKASDAAPTSENDDQSQTFPPLPKRTQREASFLSVSSGDGHDDDALHHPLAPPGARPVINAEPTLSPEQRQLVDAIVYGQRNVFFTGSAGCGKSTVLRTAIRELREQQRVTICAPTGRAAVQIGGMTTYSYMGWAPKLFEGGIKALKDASWKMTVRKRLRRTNVLIIDEISMVSSDFLNRMNACLKEVRADKAHLPFGGIKVIVTGDFCQLAPVNPFEFCYNCGARLTVNKVTGIYRCPKSSGHGPWTDEDKWAFRSSAWAEANFACFNLSEIHRQNDPVFVRMLEKCRLGFPFTENDIDLLMNHNCEVEDAPQLFCTRKEVDPINKGKFNAIMGFPKRQYRVLDGFDCRERHKYEYQRYFNTLPNNTLAVHENHPLDPVVNLKETMQVMLQVNLDIRAGLVNGSQGVICGWERIDLARLPELIGDHSDVREHFVREFTIEHLRLYPDEEDQVWPVVRFNNGKTRTIYPWCVANPVGLEEPFSFLHITQIPLVPGWAITVHKSQGMTLERVIVNLTEAFAEGQVYVALSRATSLRGLKVAGSAQGLTVGEGGNEEVRQFLADTFGTGKFEQLEEREPDES
ncbi:atp-dependent dna helicase pif1 [Fusarium mexicanum]|uniref:ATP-dependent DNA helicase n=1 Tax=Fusarium mexicanum TaxID=751941 RepID=A0A8H5JD02_9HYPO|nr:atp-dependent dna helicase pif1 [Fusarium mexicanum]